MKKQWKWFLEVVEGQNRLPTEKHQGYDSRAEAEEAAKKYINIRLMNNYVKGNYSVRVMKHVSSVHFRKNGEDYIQKEGKTKGAILYACMIEESLGGFSGWSGPNPSLEAMLAEEPEEENLRHVIVGFNPDGTNNVIYRWNKKKGWRPINAQK